MMRLLLITNNYPNPIHPTRGTFNLEMTRALRKMGHQIDIVTPVSWIDEWQARRKGRIIGQERHAVLHGMHVYYPRYYYPPKVLRTWYGGFLWHSVRDTLVPLAKANPPDIVLSYWAHPDGYVGLRLARQIGRPCVVMTGGSDVLILCEKAGRQRCIMNVFDGADRVICVSQDLANKIGGLGVDLGRIYVCRRGVDHEKFCPGVRREARQRLGLPQDVPIVLFVGNFVQVKNVETLLAAAATLKTRYADFRLMLIGRGKLENALKRKCGSLGLDEHVRFVGPVLHEALPDWYRAANVTVLPSWSEGIPNVLLESMATGIPFVASNVGGIPEIATEGVDRLVPPGDSLALADAIAEQLLKGDEKADQARKLFTWSDAAQTMTDLLQPLLNGCGQNAVACHANA